MRQVWSLQTGEISFPLVLQAVRDTVAVASSAGEVSLINARTGELVWRADIGATVNAGVGHDGRTATLVTAENELVALEDGRELWRQRLDSPSYTPPLVAGARVFVLGADRSVSAFDGRSGRRLWNQTRTGEALVLRQPGLLTAVGDTLVVGLGGRLAGLHPMTGASRWEVAISTPRGTNDVERLVDLVAGPVRDGTALCVRAFQSALGCVDAANGVLQWSKPASGASGLAGDGRLLMGVEFDGTLAVWQRGNGDRAWTMDQLRYRNLTSPALVGPSVVLGDSTGRLHFYNREDGALQTRYETTPIMTVYVPMGEEGFVPPPLDTGANGIVSTPLLAGNTLVVVTRAGRVLGLRPE